MFLPERLEPTLNLDRLDGECWRRLPAGQGPTFEIAPILENRRIRFLDLGILLVLREFVLRVVRRKLTKCSLRADTEKSWTKFMPPPNRPTT